MQDAKKMTRIKIGLLLLAVAAMSAMAVLFGGGVQAQGGGSGVFNHFVYLPMVSNVPPPTPSPYPYPLCFGEDADWDGDRQYATDGGNDVVSQEMPVTIEYPITCVGWIHLDDTLFAPYPDADFWHLGIPAGDTGHAKITVTGLPDGMVLNWSYCNDADCNTFEWMQDGSGTGVRTITIPLLPDGGIIGIQPTWHDQFDNVNYYTLHLEKLP